MVKEVVPSSNWNDGNELSETYANTVQRIGHIEAALQRHFIRFYDNL
jgi:hypothetical protein